MESKKILLVLVILAAAAAGYVLIRDLKASDSVKLNVEKKSDISTETKPAAKVNSSAKTEASNNVNNNPTNTTKPMALDIKTTQEGTGERVIKNGDTIAVHYTGKLTNGTKFDSSLDRGTPFEFQIGQGMVIQGWEKGFIGAKVGEKRTLTIPAEMGYGSRDMGTIPANSTLIFDVEVVSIK